MKRWQYAGFTEAEGAIMVAKDPQWNDELRIAEEDDQATDKLLDRASPDFDELALFHAYLRMKPPPPAEDPAGGPGDG